MLKKWEKLPDFMRIPEVKPYYDMLKRKKWQLVIKRVFDFTVAIILLVILAVPMIIIAAFIRLDSKGPVFYRQERITTYGKKFRIHKFRTMVNSADTRGPVVTVSGDSRVTKVGKKLRHLRLDELPQLFDVIAGTMSFVGARPEVTKYVERYQPEFYATLLMPSGITSEASIRYKDEDKLLGLADNVDEVYINEILPQKMVWNLESIRRFRFLREILTMIRTVFAVFGKNYT